MDVEVGVRIRARRLEVGMTQEELGAASEVSYQQIQKYETAANRVSASRLSLVAKALGVEPSHFMGEADGGARPSPEAIEVARIYDAVGDAAVRKAVRDMLERARAA